MQIPSAEPSISSFVPPWLSAISIKGSREKFQVLPPAKDLRSASPSYTKIEEIPLDKDIQEYLDSDPFPIPLTADREGYHGERHFDWWLSGLKDFLSIKATLRRHGASLCAGDSIFELGCASGRALRHFSCHLPEVRLWAADINLRHVEWVRLHLTNSIRVLHNTILPHLPIEDNSLSLVYAFSVFTHIDDFDLAWLAEIRRILKPGGIAYVSIHGEHTWAMISEGQGLQVKSALLEMRRHIKDYHVTEELFKRPLPNPKTVFWWDTAQNYNSNVFLTTDYIKQSWGRYFEVLELIKEGHDYQDVIVLRKN